MTTPKIVIKGWVSAIFFCKIKRIRLSILVITTNAYINKPIALPQSPVIAIYATNGNQMIAVPTIGIIVAKQVNSPNNNALGASKMKYPNIAILPCITASRGIPIAFDLTSMCTSSKTFLLFFGLKGNISYIYSSIRLPPISMK